MRVVQWNNIIVHHQLPIARELAKSLGNDSFRYVYSHDMPKDRVAQGYGVGSDEPWIISKQRESKVAEDWLLNADVLLTGERDFDVFEKRSKIGKITLYCSERWFKPPWGMLRFIRPSYLRMAIRFYKLLTKDVKFYYLPIGIYAATDMARMCGLMAGIIKNIFYNPHIEIEKKPFGLISKGRYAGSDDYIKCCRKMRLWGYFVSKSTSTGEMQLRNQSRPVRVLWVGRMLKWKRLDTIIAAVKNQENVTLDIFGLGPELGRLKKMSRGCDSQIKFHKPVSFATVRNLMRSFDVYVLSSNGQEGWGAVVNEALEERMLVIGTKEAGASATILPESNLYNAGNVEALRKMLKSDIGECHIGCWSVEDAALKLCTFIRETCNVL